MDDDIYNICGDMWNDLSFDPATKSNECHISFVIPIASGFRFRYQSEIDKKSYSLLKGEKNQCPILEVVTTEPNAILKIQLITNEGFPHFSMFYEVNKEKQSCVVHKDEITLFVEFPGIYKYKLESFGIRKMKQKEAVDRIKDLYPHISAIDAKAFFDKHKDIVVVKATLFQFDLPAAIANSGPIKCQSLKENKAIKIRHIAPKVVAEFGEELIVVLEKKITTDEFEASLSLEGHNATMLIPSDNDGQTFIFKLPEIEPPNAVIGYFSMKCGENYDQKPIRFLPIITEQRKRKRQEAMSSNLPLKRSNIYEQYENNAKALFPETAGTFDDIQTDNAFPMDIGDYNLEDNDYSKDSGIHSGEGLSDKCSNNEIDSSTEENDDISSSNEESDEEFIEVEGFRRRKNVIQSKPLERIVIPPKIRSQDSQLDIKMPPESMKKILTEVARIGHDFAFGKTPNDLFERIEKQLPVVFTLQDDVGDTPLNNAILKGNIEQAFKILQVVQTHCDWAIDLVNTSGHSALILAPACDVPSELISKLLIAGCRLDLVDDIGKSAITYAIEYQNVKALEVLLKHAQMNNMRNVLSRYESNYYSPLQLAVINKFYEGIKMLLELKDSQGQYLIDVNEIGLMNNETALHIAVSHNCGVEIIEMILQRPDNNINQEMCDKTTALHLATRMKFMDIINLLIKYHATNHINGSEFEDSDEEIDDESADMETVSSDIYKTEEKMPEVEMSVDICNSNKVSALTEDMNKLSLKGDLKNKLIEILINSNGPTLNVGELKSIVKPTFKTLFNKYGNTDEHKKDIYELLIRFNCLPNSVGELVEHLETIKRLDLVEKIKNNLTI